MRERQAPHPINRLIMKYWCRARPATSTATCTRATRWRASRCSTCPATRPGTSRYWRESDRVLILGDVLNNMDVITGLPGLRDPKPFFTPDPAENRRSARKLAQLEPKLVVFGHGAAAARHAQVRGLRELPPELAAGTLGRPMAADRSKHARGAHPLRARATWSRACSRAGRSPGSSTPRPRATPAENYSIAIPPPNVTGALHMGHALNGSIQDVLHPPRAHARQARQVDLRHRPRRHRHPAPGREGARGGGHDQGGARPRGVRRARLGVARAVRLDDHRAVQAPGRLARLRGRALHDGRRLRSAPSRTCSCTCTRRASIYRDNYMVNWDPGLRSAISDLEVEQRTVEDTLYSIDYPLESGSGSITVATVRPETMLADTAIAVNPEDDRYSRLIGETRDPAARRAGGCRSSPTSTSTPSSAPARSRSRPGHDPNDFEIGRRHGLDEVTRDRRGRAHDRRRPASASRGMDVDDAREAVVAELREEGLVSGTRAVRARRAALAPLRPAHRAADLAPVVLRHERARASRRSRSSRDGRVSFHPERRGPTSTSTGWRTSAPGASRASSGGATSCRSGTAARRPTSGVERARGRRLGARPGRARHVVLLRPVAVRDARLARADARAARLLPDRRATRPRATSSSSGSRAW